MPDQVGHHRVPRGLHIFVAHPQVPGERLDELHVHAVAAAGDEIRVRHPQVAQHPLLPDLVQVPRGGGAQEGNGGQGDQPGQDPFHGAHGCVVHGGSFPWPAGAGHRPIEEGFEEVGEIVGHGRIVGLDQPGVGALALGVREVQVEGFPQLRGGPGKPTAICWGGDMGPMILILPGHFSRAISASGTSSKVNSASPEMRAGAISLRFPARSMTLAPVSVSEYRLGSRQAWTWPARSCRPAPGAPGRCRSGSRGTGGSASPSSRPGR